MIDQVLESSGAPGAVLYVGSVCAMLLEFYRRLVPGRSEPVYLWATLVTALALAVTLKLEGGFGDLMWASVILVTIAGAAGGARVQRSVSFLGREGPPGG